MKHPCTCKNSKGFPSASVGVDGQVHYPGCPLNPSMPDTPYRWTDNLDCPIWCDLYFEAPYVRESRT